MKSTVSHAPKFCHLNSNGVVVSQIYVDVLVFGHSFFFFLFRHCQDYYHNGQL